MQTKKVHNIKVRIVNFLKLFVATASICHPAAAFELSSDEKATLKSGQAVVRVAPTEAPADGHVMAAIDIAAPRARVWQVLSDCAHAPAVMPNLTYCAVLENGPGGQWDIREHRVTWIKLLPEIRTQFRSDYVKDTSIRFQLVGGDMRALEGEWRLEPLKGGAATRLTYNARVGFGALIPGFVIRNALANDVPGFLMAIKAVSTQPSAPQTAAQ
ncbi:MAG: polyketide cyclase [Hyphomicrobium sp.]|nr:MAG: polyketide cyclase [Hyphomicrobium sp.]PPD01632.1 MAG: polyketide cyclase [Hyphomicrobium sp.]